MFASRGQGCDVPDHRGSAGRKVDLHQCHVERFGKICIIEIEAVRHARPIVINAIMAVFLASVAAALVFALVAVYALDAALQRPADQAFVSPTSVRVPDHGETHNLVGKDWYSAREH
jgi:hypothetical protein